jgi:hypothetical protein
MRNRGAKRAQAALHSIGAALSGCVMNRGRVAAASFGPLALLPVRHGARLTGDDFTA